MITPLKIPLTSEQNLVLMAKFLLQLSELILHFSFACRGHFQQLV